MNKSKDNIPCERLESQANKTRILLVNQREKMDLQQAR